MRPGLLRKGAGCEGTKRMAIRERTFRFEGAEGADIAGFRWTDDTVTPHAVLEVRTGTGDLVWRFDRDGPKPRQVMPPGVAADMIKMMNSVVENGTGKRSRLDGVTSAGKTGTTNAYRDAWFMGITGQYVAGVWMGNDDFSPMSRVTGGSFPA